MSQAKYRVSRDYDERYRVETVSGFEQDDYGNEVEVWEEAFSGSLSDCEAYIRLRQNDDVEFRG